MAAAIFLSKGCQSAQNHIEIARRDIENNDNDKRPNDHQFSTEIMHPHYKILRVSKFARITKPNSYGLCCTFF